MLDENKAATKAKNAADKFFNSKPKNYFLGVGKVPKSQINLLHNQFVFAVKYLYDKLYLENNYIDRLYDCDHASNLYLEYQTLPKYVWLMDGYLSNKKKFDSPLGILKIEQGNKPYIIHPGQTRQSIVLHYEKDNEYLEGIVYTDNIEHLSIEFKSYEHMKNYFYPKKVKVFSNSYKNILHPQSYIFSETTSYKDYSIGDDKYNRFNLEKYHYHIQNYLKNNKTDRDIWNPSNKNYPDIFFNFCEKIVNFKNKSTISNF